MASSTNSKFAIVENKIKNFYGVQFHPEVTHTEDGKKIIGNFIFSIVKLNVIGLQKIKKFNLLKMLKNSWF